MNEKFTVKTLPRVNSSKTLMARRSEGEPVVVVVLEGAGSTAPYAYSGRGNKSYWFEWDRTRQLHALRVPASIWNAKDGVARDLLDQNKLTLPLIPLFEWDAPTKPTPTTADDAPVEIKPDVGSEETDVDHGTSSTATSPDETGKKRKKGVSGVQEQSRTGPSVLSEVQGGSNEGVEGYASLDSRAESEGERPVLREGVSTAREAQEEAVRAMRGGQITNAPPGLQQASGSRVVVSPVPPDAPQERPKNKGGRPKGARNKAKA